MTSQTLEKQAIQRRLNELNNLIQMAARERTELNVKLKKLDTQTIIHQGVTITIEKE